LEASIEAAVGIFLGLLIILIAYTLFFPMIEERQRQATFVQARNLALELHSAIESVAASGKGTQTTIRFEVPAEVVIHAGPGDEVNKSVWIALKNPPEYAGSVVIATGAISIVNQTIEDSQIVFKIRSTGDWNITLSGVVPSGAEVPFTVSNAGNKTVVVRVGWGGG